MPMTDDQLDSLIDKAKPDLRIALRSVLYGQSCHFFNIAQQSFPNGQKWQIVCTILSEPLSALVEGIVNTGIPSMAEVYRRAGFNAGAFSDGPSKSSAGESKV